MKTRNVGKLAVGKRGGTGAYTTNSFSLNDPGLTDESGNPIARRREIRNAVDDVSGLGMSRNITRAPVKRYDPL